MTRFHIAPERSRGMVKNDCLLRDKALRQPDL